MRLSLSGRDRSLPAPGILRSETCDAERRACVALQTDLDRTRETMDATFGELETEHEKTLGDLKQAMAYGPRALLVASHVTACTRPSSASSSCASVG